MNYSAAKAHGFPIGSGQIESICNQHASQHLKCSGMHLPELDVLNITDLRGCLNFISSLTDHQLTTATRCKWGAVFFDLAIGWSAVFWLFSGTKILQETERCQGWIGLTPNERLIAEQAVMNFRALNAACDAAADGTVLSIAEQQAVKQGCDATRRTLEMSLQMQGADVEKSEPSRTCGCGINKSHHGRNTRTVMTQAGEIGVSRVYRCCVKWQNCGYAVDERLGIQGRYSVQSRRLISLGTGPQSLPQPRVLEFGKLLRRRSLGVAAANWFYDVSSERLEELCGVSVSDTSVRDISQAAGAQMLEWQRTEPAAVGVFDAAVGDVKFTTDGPSVNTTEG